jgi:sec-independent protein translocase protein TatA
MGRGLFEGWHLIILALIVIVIFGWKRLPDAARSLGRSARVFKSEVDEMKKETEASKSAAANETVTSESITRDRTTTDTSTDRVVPAPEDGNAIRENAPRTDNQSGPVA